MITLTKEWLQQTIAELEEERDATPGAVNVNAAMALAAMKLALTTLEAKFRTDDVSDAELNAALLLHRLKVDGHSQLSDAFRSGFKYARRTAPPASVSVPEEMDGHGGVCCEVSYADGWNACRAAMLQGAEPVTTAYKLPEGWVAVPVEPTEDMIVNGFESEPDESFSDEKEWGEYEAMSGCQQAAHRAKLCWAAMIATAPKV